jgi:S-adenosylmethionine-diacylglycerol 3-amino-3-carboxypropyl transferase
MNPAARAVRRETSLGLTRAVHRSRALSRAGLSERLFTLAFSGLVYPQIWEDPVVDMEALGLGPRDHVVAIASGSCNVLSYLTADPARISAVDLNGAHIALGRLKLAALARLPDHAAYLRFFGRADAPANVAAYDARIAPGLDPASRAYWEARRLDGRRRIAAFSGNIFRHGLLGRFIGTGHRLARLYGCDLSAVLEARDRAEQRALFAAHVAPLFEKRLVRWLIQRPASLYGLGIPPAQYTALAGDRPGGMVAVLRHRLERLACDFDLSDNYFAWQAFGRSYAPGDGAALPPYLQPRHFEALRARAERVSYRQQAMTAFLAASPDASADAYVLLDAQDWMSDADLTALWTQITRTARPGARVIFRTAADERRLPGRVPDAILNAWDYAEAESRAGQARDRSAIYGGFHLYRLRSA